MRNALFLAVGLAAACAPAAEQPAASAPAAPDTAAVRLAIQAVSDRYAELDVAGDAAGIAGLYAENGTAAFFGFPTTTGRAGIEAIYRTLFGIQKLTAATSTVLTASSPAPGLATAGGTFAETVDSSGTIIRNWWRWAAAYRQGADSRWEISFIMAFPDSTSRK